MRLPSAVLFAALSARWILGVFRRLGPLGLLLMGALDSSFLFLPFGNDVLLIALVSGDRESWRWIFYVLMSAIGSVLGVYVVDLLMRKAGDEGLKKFLQPKRIAKLRKKMEKNAGWAVFTATLIPPPFPFTGVVMVASALQCSRRLLLGAVFLGRLIRFTIEALLAIYFGRRILRLMESPIVDYFVYGLIVVAVIGSSLSVMKWIRRTERSTTQTQTAN